MHVPARPWLPAVAVSFLLHAGALLLALSAVTTHVHQRPEPLPIVATLLPPPTPPEAAPVMMAAPEPAPAQPMPQPAPKPTPRPRPAPAPKPRPAPPPPRPEASRATALPAAEAPAVAAPAAVEPVAPVAPPAPPPAPVRTGVSISASYAASNRPPIQPARSLRNNEEGKVVLRVLVQADGSAGDVQVRTSSGFPMLDEAARNAVQTWRFNPATSDGKPVAEWYLVPVIFKLSN